MGSPEDAAFVDFARANAPALLRTARLLTGNWAAGEDLLQATLARCWVYRRRLFATERPPAYARTVMASLAASSWRRRWRAETPVAQVPDRAIQPDATTVLDTRLGLDAALATLSARARAVIVLRYYEDWPVADVAAALNCSTGTVKSLASRALDQLRAQPQVADLLAAPAAPAGSPAGEGDVTTRPVTPSASSTTRGETPPDPRRAVRTIDPEVTK